MNNERYLKYSFSSSRYCVFPCHGLIIDGLVSKQTPFCFQAIYNYWHYDEQFLCINMKVNKMELFVKVYDT